MFQDCSRVAKTGHCRGWWEKHTWNKGLLNRPCKSLNKNDFIIYLSGKWHFYNLKTAGHATHCWHLRKQNQINKQNNINNLHFWLWNRLHMGRHQEKYWQEVIAEKEWFCWPSLVLIKAIRHQLRSFSPETSKEWLNLHDFIPLLHMHLYIFF